MIYSQEQSRWFNPYRNDHLAHYGIKGQQWGVRRFQNEDGTLTEEGKARYLDRISPDQRKMYSRLPEERQRILSRKLGQGKSWAQATKEMHSELTRNAIVVGSLALVTTAGMMAYTMNPKVAKFMNTMKARAVNKIVSTNAFHRGSQYLQRQMRRSAAKKNGAITLGKGSYKVLRSEILG